MPLFYLAGLAGTYFYGRYAERGAIVQDAVGGGSNATNFANLLLTFGAGYVIYRGLKHA